MAKLGTLGQHAVVSSESEQLILVNSDDSEIGRASKASCHDGQGLLHRAFSLFLFNAKGELLMQQRSAQKRLWPHYWSNSCCSHPRAGEAIEVAVQRRLTQELGMQCSPRFLYKFQYHARYDEQGSENELCSVFAARAQGDVLANRTEVAAWRYIDPTHLDQEIVQQPDRFTPWFKLEWQRLQQEFQHELGQLS